VSESLDPALARLSGPGGGSPASLFARWAEIAGPEFAPHVQPVRLADGELTVSVDQPARATAVRAGAGGLLARAREATGQPAERLHVSVRRTGRDP
jgi:predicted nucleic acid-binding Zn ribbon protein